MVSLKLNISVLYRSLVFKFHSLYCCYLSKLLLSFLLFSHYPFPLSLSYTRSTIKQHPPHLQLLNHSFADTSSACVSASRHQRITFPSQPDSSSSLSFFSRLRSSARVSHSSAFLFHRFTYNKIFIFQCVTSSIIKKKKISKV